MCSFSLFLVGGSFQAGRFKRARFLLNSFWNVLIFALSCGGVSCGGVLPAGRPAASKELVSFEIPFKMCSFSLFRVGGSSRLAGRLLQKGSFLFKFLLKYVHFRPFVWGGPSGRTVFGIVAALQRCGIAGLLQKCRWLWPLIFWICWI